MLKVINNVIWQPATIAPVVDMTGKAVIVTGTTQGGIGFDTAKILASQGAHVILASRTESKMASEKSAILEEYPNAQVSYAPCDLSDLSSVREFERKLYTSILEPACVIDVLICNSGVHLPGHSVTSDGVEETFAVCALGHHLLIFLLSPNRVVWLTGHIYILSKGPVSPLADNLEGSDAYSRACLARLFLVRELKRRNQDAGIAMEVVAVHPGVINTNLLNTSRFTKFILRQIFLDTFLGAQASVFTATAPVQELHQDRDLPYYHNKFGWYDFPEGDLAMDQRAAVSLFDECDALCSITRTNSTKPPSLPNEPSTDA